MAFITLHGSSWYTFGQGHFVILETDMKRLQTNIYDRFKVLFTSQTWYMDWFIYTMDIW